MLKKLAVLVSGGGTDLQSVIDACEGGILKDRAVVDYVAASRDGAGAIDRAKKHGIDYGVFRAKDYVDVDRLCAALASTLIERGIDVVVLAGYLTIVTNALIKPFEGRIINIHPALLPRHGGKGYYGMNVHRAVIAAGDAESGATVHHVSEVPDGGAIIMQEKIPVLPGDTAETLASRVLELEHVLLPKAITKVLERLS